MSGNEKRLFNVFLTIFIIYSSYNHNISVTNSCFIYILFNKQIKVTVNHLNRSILKYDYDATIPNHFRVQISNTYIIYFSG